MSNPFNIYLTMSLNIDLVLATQLFTYIEKMVDFINKGGDWRSE